MALQVSKVAWTEVCLGVSQTTHDLYGLKRCHSIIRYTIGSHVPTIETLIFKESSAYGFQNLY
jgi:hypothetical protein